MQRLAPEILLWASTALLHASTGNSRKMHVENVHMLNPIFREKGRTLGKEAVSLPVTEGLFMPSIRWEPIR